MCFSAQASFAASAGLFFIGWLVNRKLKRPEQRMFALIPCLFAIQQAAEGVVWLTVDQPDFWVHRAAIYLFLFFAYLWWPFYIARSLLPLESVAWRRQVLAGLSVFGGFLCGFLLVCIVHYGINAAAIDCHIVYQLQRVTIFDRLLGAWYDVGLVLYAVATLAPFFISTVPRMWMIGAAIGAAMIASYIWYYMAFVSVWCFFAAIISAMIYVVCG